MLIGIAHEAHAVRTRWCPPSASATSQAVAVWLHLCAPTGSDELAYTQQLLVKQLDDLGGLAWTS